MRINKSEGFVLILAAFSFCVSVCMYPLVPEWMASHWNIKGEVDAYLPRFWGLFLLPLILTGVTLLLIAVPRIDPLKENIWHLEGIMMGSSYSSLCSSYPCTYK
ncbi:MAG: DUF1648 domain-containing protein [Candidatus Bathyarchaeia archaeon]